MDVTGRDSEPPHRTANMIGMPNHAIAVGDLTGGRVWIEDDEGMSPVENRDEKQNSSASRLVA